MKKVDGNYFRENGGAMTAVELESEKDNMDRAMYR